MAQLYTQPLTVFIPKSVGLCACSSLGLFVQGCVLYRE